jgi:hypothetical protein
VRETRIRGAVGDIEDIFPVRHACLVSFFWHARTLLEPWLSFILLYNKADYFSYHFFYYLYITHFFLSNRLLHRA